MASEKNMDSHILNCKTNIPCFVLEVHKTDSFSLLRFGFQKAVSRVEKISKLFDKSGRHILLLVNKIMLTNSQSSALCLAIHLH